MSTTKVKNFIQPGISGLDTKWDEAIRDARRKIKKLEQTIVTYKALKKAGERWPMDNAATQI